jgi:YebC/PmpR family DNA-binding regulatory protein
MSGHSKWATIKRKKGAADARRGKLFTKLIREIATAARIGGGDPGANPRLRLAVDKARAANMPKDTIERAILRGSGGGEDSVFEEVTYEGYGPGGTAVLVEGLTDNRKRTVGEVRHVFTKAGASLGAPGCVAHLFEKKGLISFDAKGVDGDALLEAALDAGADDVREAGDQLVVVTAPGSFEAVKAGLDGRGFRPAGAELTLEPSTTVPLLGGDAEAMLKLAEALEDLDDVQAVYANYDIPDDVMQKLAG